MTSVTINASRIGLFSISSKQSFALFYQLRMKIGTVEFRLPSESTPKFNTHDLIGVKHVQNTGMQETLSIPEKQDFV